MRPCLVGGADDEHLRHPTLIRFSAFVGETVRRASLILWLILSNAE